MTVRTLWYTGPDRLEWREAPRPRLQGDGEAVVEPVVASRCAFDRPVIAGLSMLPPPFQIGHEAVARVVEVGPAVTRVAPGDLAVVSANISCGRCERCLAGRNAHCRTVPRGAAYGIPTGGSWGGLYDDLVRVPYADAMLTPVPDGVDPVELVVAADSLGIGYELMTQRLREGRERIAVLGWAEHGLFQVAFAVGLGASRVCYIDDDAENRAVAESLGAEAVPGPPDRQHGPFDLVVVASPDLVWARRAVHLVEPEGVVDALGGSFGDYRLPVWKMYGQGITFRVYRGNHGPDSVAATVDAVARGLIRPSIVYSRLVDWEDIPKAMAEPGRKLVTVRAA